MQIFWHSETYLRIFVLLFFLLKLAKTSGQEAKYQFRLDELAKYDPIHCQMRQEANSKEKFLEIKTDSLNAKLRFPGVDDGYAWNRAKYLVIDWLHQNGHSLIFYLSFFDGIKAEIPRLELKAGILPEIKTRFVFPLSFLNGQSIYPPKFPRQLKTYVSGTGIDPSEIQKVELCLGPHQKDVFQPGARLINAWLSDDFPEPLPSEKEPYIDEFGQMKKKTWPGKTKDRKNLNENLRKRADPETNVASGLSRFGGNLKMRFPKSGFFKTHFDGKRWWMVDPDGFAFLSSGVDAVRPGSPCPAVGNEDLFKELPDPSNEGKGIYTFSRNLLQFNSLAWNLKKAFGENWLPAWRQIAKKDLKSWAFNTIGNWSEPGLCLEARMPYVFPMAGFPKTQKYLFRDFPDVFDPSFRDSCARFASQLETLKTDTFLIGYFLSNEPEWAFGNHNLAAEMLRRNEKSYSRKALVSWLSKRYKNEISQLNSEWKEDFKSFSDLDSGQIELTENGRNALLPFTELLVDSLIKKVCEATRKVDSNHLNLGLRYAWISSDLCYRAGTYFDVFSLNGYSQMPPDQTKTITQKTGKPVLIGEFHFGALDRGLPASGIVGAANTLERAWAIRAYMEETFHRPEVVGLYYFLMYDQPVLGRFDGENYNVGLFDICLQPYPELKKEVKKAHERMYKLAKKRQKPHFPKLKKVEALYY